MKAESNFLKGSLILLLLTNLFNFFNLLFQIFVAHNLSVESYGIFTALFSVIYIFAIFSESIQLTTAKNIAKSKSLEQSKKLVNSAILGSIKMSAGIFVIYLIILFVAKIYLDISFSLIILNSCIILFSLAAAPVFRGILQGQKRFLDLGLNLVSEGITKIILVIIFLLLGLQIYGAFGAIVASMLVSFVYGLWQTKKLIYLKNKDFIKINFLSTFKIDVILLISYVMILYMLDVFLAAIVLEPNIAGYYAIASTIAKTAFAGTYPISKTLLSYLVSAKTNKDKRRILTKSLFLLSSLLLFGFILIYFFSDLVVFLFSGTNKELASKVLPITFLGVSFISLSNLIINYKIALDKTKNTTYLGLIIIGLIIALITIPTTLLTFSIVYLIGTIIFLITSAILLR